MSRIILDNKKELSEEKEALLRRIMERTIISSKIEGINISKERAYQMALKIANQVEKEERLARA